MAIRAGKMFVYVAVGYPERKFMPVKRRPLDEVLTRNRV